MKYGLADLIVNVDSSTVVSYLKIKVPPWNARSKVKRIKETMVLLKSCVVEHCYRETNALAEVIADMDACVRLEELDATQLSYACNSIIIDDKNGKLYERVKNY